MEGRQKVAIAGLGRLAAWIFWVWGAVVLGKGFFDCFLGEPEANLFSVVPWTIVTREQWLRYGGFEIVFGVACLGMGFVLRAYAQRLPLWVERPVTEL